MAASSRVKGATITPMTAGSAAIAASSGAVGSPRTSTGIGRMPASRSASWAASEPGATIDRSSGTVPSATTSAVGPDGAEAGARSQAASNVTSSSAVTERRDTAGTLERLQPGWRNRQTRGSQKPVGFGP